MVIVRNVFKCKPGQAKLLIKKLKDTIDNSNGAMRDARVLSDVASSFWTVILETQSNSLEEWEKQFEQMSRTDMRKPMEGYMEHVDGGHREIYRVE